MLLDMSWFILNALYAIQTSPIFSPEDITGVFIASVFLIKTGLMLSLPAGPVFVLSFSIFPVLSRTRTEVISSSFIISAKIGINQ